MGSGASDGIFERTVGGRGGRGGAHSKAKIRLARAPHGAQLPADLAACRAKT